MVCKSVRLVKIPPPPQKKRGARRKVRGNFFFLLSSACVLEKDVTIKTSFSNKRLSRNNMNDKINFCNGYNIPQISMNMYLIVWGEKQNIMHICIPQAQGNTKIVVSR